MTIAGPIAHDVVDWAIASRPLPGELVSGDLHLVTMFEGGVLVAAIDGLGHGPKAAAAARAAAEALSRRPNASVLDLIQLCHQELKPTRGAAMSLASFNARTNLMTWAGIGDVKGILISVAEARQNILLRNGVVGYRLPPLRSADLPVGRGDMLIFATDGVGGGFTATVAGDRQAQEIANDILLRHGKLTDDALVLVVRYRGMAA